MFAHFDLLTVGVLVPGDLHEGLGLGDALLLHIDPAEVLGDGLQHPGALDVGVVVAVVEVAVTGRDLSLTVFTLESKYLLVLREKLEIFVKNVERKFLETAATREKTRRSLAVVMVR